MSVFKSHFLSLALALSLPGAGVITAASSIEGRKTATVEIKNFAFVPAVLNVTAGDTVTWTNLDEDPHTVVANDKSFRSRALDTGERDSFVFEAPGEYGYYCSLHPHMTAKVIVKAP